MKKIINKSFITFIALFLSSSLSLAAEVNKAAPNFSIMSLVGGETINLDAYKGKVVYLDFWASWCGPCLKSFPYMEHLQSKFGDKGLVIIAVSLDEERNDALNFYNKNKPSFKVGHNPEGDLASLYNVQAMPSSFLIGRDGKIKNAHLGFKEGDKEAIRKMIVDQL